MIIAKAVRSLTLRVRLRPGGMTPDAAPQLRTVLRGGVFSLARANIILYLSRVREELWLEEKVGEGCARSLA